ncbi:MAG: DUF4255 domain-containing protein [Gammaproteobacteria bacterium]|nr:DUF4255 domain-containing protein [Gammaproteobacteria bacterium]
MSKVCKALAEYVKTQIELINSETSEIIQVVIGNPLNAEKSSSAGSDTHLINLFFYHFNTSEFDSQAFPGEVNQLRVRCLITPFSQSNTVTEGENDLRLIGEILRIFHEQPVWNYTDEYGDILTSVQIIFRPLAMEEVSQLWGSQEGVSYRPSVSYELALIPVQPNNLRRQAPLVSDVSLNDGAIANVTGAQHTWDDDWLPDIAFVMALNDGLGKRYFDSLHLLLDSNKNVIAINKVAPAVLALFNDHDLTVWIAGADASTSNELSVTLHFDRLNDDYRWEKATETFDMVATSLAVDAEQAATATTAEVDLSWFQLSQNFGQTQFTVYATRSYLRTRDNALITLRSKPLLVTVVTDE